MQPAADFGDVLLSNAEGVRVRMHRVMAGHQVVRMLDRGAKDKAGIGERFELDRLMTFVEYRGFARRYLFWRPYSPPVGCDPGDVMSAWAAEISNARQPSGVHRDM